MAIRTESGIFHRRRIGGLDLGSVIKPLEQNHYGPAIVRLREEFFFFKEDDKKWTFVLTLPENIMGSIQSQLMIREAHNSYKRYGFQPASLFLQYSLWPFLVIEKSDEVKSGAIYITYHDQNLEIVSTSHFWTGLYRGGDLLYAREACLDGIKPLNSPIDYFHQLTANQNFAMQDLKKVWDTKKGDILVISESDFPLDSTEIIQQTVKIIEGRKGPVYQIVSLLDAYYNIAHEEGRVFAAIRIN